MGLGKHARVVPHLLALGLAVPEGEKGLGVFSGVLRCGAKGREGGETGFDVFRLCLAPPSRPYTAGWRDVV
ncbi:MAG: hypothetical protein IPL28_14865 [Chloroflexi bacterium]|nr:hypothetical protein [Chloroflexota bacterium]